MSVSLITGSILTFPDLRLRPSPSYLTISSPRTLSLSSRSKPSSLHQFSQISPPIKITARGAMETTAETISGGVPNATMKLLFVEMGVGYDQHGYLQIYVCDFSCSTLKISVLIQNLQKKIETGKT
ncbi:unnamed protein product [Thlaspi arvense]|uniref:Uncharacterized protein n=1 Tax=Thlaspi arvense TaxID=13288 RepID=A0AAU9R953_THLAR|nr:unnamed protein product [Thlaspi arvense]